MELKVNQEKRQFPDGTSLREILVFLDINTFDGMAVALNSQVIPKIEWQACRPAEGDEITIIRAVQGG